MESVDAALESAIEFLPAFSKAISLMAWIFQNPQKPPWTICQVRDPSAAPTDFIFAAAREKSPAEKSVRDILFFEIDEFCPRIFHKKDIAIPPKYNIWKDWLTNRLVKKRDTLKVVGSAYNR